MPDLLFLTQRLPYPPIKGEKIRPLQILKYLTQWYDVHLGCLIDDPSDAQHIETIRAMCRDIHVARLNRKRAKLTCLSGLLTGESLSVTFFEDRDLRRWVRRVVEQVRPAVIFVNSGNMAPYILDLPKREIRICDLADVDSEKWHAYAETTKGPMRFVYRREWRKVAALEHRIADACDVSSFVSDAEAALFKRLVPDRAARIRGVSSGVDHRYFDPTLPHAPVYDTTLPTYVFTGTMDYPPNVDAVVWFATEILPLIRRTVPTAQFYIVGNGPSAEVQRLAQITGVFVTGRVPDVRPYVAHATAGVAPMRIARGIQNKVLEAMSLGKPVVLTSGALEGIEAQPGTDVILADDAETFAAGCCRLATSNDGAAIGAAARSRIVRDYDWSARLRRFDDLLRPAPADQVSEIA
ncbi:MAG TPA: TIGR03087 family PEP-CTERM/XrtA system glycosyltransferase [Rhodopila sp.]|jgi:sugar transferase (PEP-CTERM/EpsH1 system associated)|nr:TIGR03087 family PEP-CTERM/XrtA system glycosyltransferase [Rhodopila sp.]